MQSYSTVSYRSQPLLEHLFYIVPEVHPFDCFGAVGKRPSPNLQGIGKSVPHLLKKQGLLLAWLAAFLLPTAVYLHPPAVTVRWQTVTELESAGFRLYRAEGDEEPHPLNQTLIPSQGDSSKGAVYQMIDQDVRRGHTYFYLLEEVSLDGTEVLLTQFRQETDVPIVPLWSLFPLMLLGGMTAVTLLRSGARIQRF